MTVPTGTDTLWPLTVIEVPAMARDQTFDFNFAGNRDWSGRTACPAD